MSDRAAELVALAQRAATARANETSLKTWLASSEGVKAAATIEALPDVTRALTDFWGVAADTNFVWSAMPGESVDPDLDVLAYWASPIGFPDRLYWLQVYVEYGKRARGNPWADIEVLDEWGSVDIKTPEALATWLTESYNDWKAAT